MELSQLDDLSQQDIPKVHGAPELYFFCQVVFEGPTRRRPILNSQLSLLAVST